MLEEEVFGATTVITRAGCKFSSLTGGRELAALKLRQDQSLEV